MDERGYWQKVARRRASRRTVLRTSAVGAVGAGAYAAVGCGDDDDDDDATPRAGTPGAGSQQLPSGFDNARYGGVLHYGITDPPQTLDFHTQETPGSHTAAHPVYNGLIYRIEDQPGVFSRLEGELAESWEQPDDTTVVLKLRDGVKWHDVDPTNGRDFTGDDVKYNIERMRGEHPAGNQVGGEFRMRDMFGAIETIDVQGNTVTLKTAEPFAPLLNNLSFAWVQMIPRELVEATGDRNVLTWAVGTGPFILDGYDTFGDGGTLRYTKNPNYWKPGQPFFDAMRAFIITQRETSQAKFLADELDTSSSIDQSQTIALGDNKPEMLLLEAPGFAVFKLYFDMLNPDSPWAKDKRLRQAMYYFMPYEIILGAVGVDCCRSGPIPPNQQPWALSEDQLPAAGLSLQDAIPMGIELLAEAGFEPGTEVPLELSISNFYGGDTLGEALAGIFGSLKDQTGGQLNINTKLNVLELGDWLTNVYRGGGRYSATTHGDWNFDDPDNTFYRYFHTDGVANNTHTSIPALDKLLVDQRRELDEEKRVEIVREIQEVLLDEATTVYIAAPNFFLGAQAYLGGYKPMVLNNVETPRHFDEWWHTEDAPGRS